MPRVDNRLMFTLPAHVPYRRRCLSFVALSLDASLEGGNRQDAVGSWGNRQTSHATTVTANSSVKLVCQRSGIDRRVTQERVMAW